MVGIATTSTTTELPVGITPSVQSKRLPPWWGGPQYPWPGVAETSDILGGKKSLNPTCWGGELFVTTIVKVTGRPTVAGSGAASWVTLISSLCAWLPLVASSGGVCPLCFLRLYRVSDGFRFGLSGGYRRRSGGHFGRSLGAIVGLLGCALPGGARLSGLLLSSTACHEHGDHHHGYPRRQTFHRVSPSLAPSSIASSLDFKLLSEKPLAIRAQGGLAGEATERESRLSKDTGPALVRGSTDSTALPPFLPPAAVPLSPLVLSFAALPVLPVLSEFALPAPALLSEFAPAVPLLLPAVVPPPRWDLRTPLCRTPVRKRPQLEWRIFSRFLLLVCPTGTQVYTSGKTEGLRPALRRNQASCPFSCRTKPLRATNHTRLSGRAGSDYPPLPW